ncbi:MltR family transcriptional regulator [Pectobacterium cacticida]|uniref:MltR family transcriptional regulator n=1 Tax=Pectobacterium cacticida TaxID=69221 RepID=A0ABZ2GCI0_9GAMM|nr:MltR family transcriptional regulator [Pectobacterium cacticida]UYX06722.1 MltR family transcriptional regulator [Pectobacterium cacticida]
MRCARLKGREVTMLETQAFENRVLEALNAENTVRDFMLCAVELLVEAVDILMSQVFRKDDYAVKYAVEPLMTGTGPLSDLSVRLKLIYGLGMIDRGEYEDAELLIALGEELAQDERQYCFTDDEILGSVGELHCVAALPADPALPPGTDSADPLLVSMKQQRYQQMVRSTLVLSLTTLIAQMSLKKAF